VVGGYFYLGGMKRQGDGEKLHNELNNFYFSFNIIKMLKSRTIRLEDTRNVFKTLV
jgi:hypothetical protein